MIAAALERSNAGEMTVDLVTSELLVAGLEAIPFGLPDGRRALLRDGLAVSRPWVYASPG